MTRCSVIIGASQVIQYHLNKYVDKLFIILIVFGFNNLFSQCIPAIPVAQCTPPSSWDVNVTINGNVDWNVITGYLPTNVTGKIKISGCGIVTVNNSNLIIKSSTAVLFMDGPSLVVNNGCILLTVSGARFIQNAGILQSAGHFEQVANTAVCITGTTIELGQEKAARKFTLGASYTSASFDNAGGYRYLADNCMNITGSFIQTQVGTGVGINGVDVVKNCFIEVGDGGTKHAHSTSIGSYDAEDSGNWESNNTQSIYNTTIIIANGQFLKTNKVSIYCDLNVRINKIGNFHINSGTIQGANLCVAIENDFGNCGTWVFNNISWYSAKKNTSNIPGSGSESSLQTLLNSCFSNSCEPANFETCGSNPPPSTEISCADNIKIPFAAGSFIINMGITPQTVKNALQPYGMIYDLIKNHNVKIIWLINPNKEKDGEDINYNNVSYKGGTFLIPAQFRTASVNSRISFWQSQGVVGASTISQIKVCPELVYKELKNVPRWTLDKKNGQLAVEYFANAGIPPDAHGGTSGSGWKNPSDLNCCDDLFVLPHAEPSWAVHERLYSWNLECKGGIWDGCTSGSALENMVNPNNRSQQTNFLTVKDPSYTGTSGIYANSNTLLLWSVHEDGTPPYVHRLPADPVAQYMSTTDGAHTNGAEQVYIPRQSSGTTSRWNPSTKILAYDPSHSNVPTIQSDLRNVASPLVYGRGFGDNNRGFVMHSAGHSYNKGDASPAHIAAQRAFFNFSWVVANDKAELVTIANVPQNMSAGIPYSLSVGLQNGQNISNYSIQWNSTCGGTFIPNANHPSPQFIPPLNFVGNSCAITVSLTDNCGRTTIDSKLIEVICDFNVSSALINPSCNNGANGSIELTITGTSNTGSNNWNWVKSSSGGSGNGSGNLISNLSSGSYNITVTSSSQCSSTFNVVIANPVALDVSLTPSHYTCFGQNGSIVTMVTGGTGSYTYNWSNGSTTKNISNLIAGAYTVTVNDSNNCSFIANTTVNGPSSGINITLNSNNIDCNNILNGTITSSVTNGIAPLNYLWNSGATSSGLNNVSAGLYSVTVTDNNGCKASSSTTISQPQPIQVTIDILQPTCPPASDSPVNSDGVVTLNVTGGVSPYTYLWNTGATTSNLINLSAGNYTVTIYDANNCQHVKAVQLINQKTFPSPPTIIIK